MKRFFIFLFIIFCSCKGSEKPVEFVSDPAFQFKCPDDGKCGFELINDVQLDIKKDSLGFYYPQILKGENILIKFTYSKNPIPNTVDGNYTEELYIELSRNQIENSLNNQDLQNVNLLFARLCYCKSQTGYYIVKSGDLSIKKITENNYKLELTFEVKEVPQIITNLTYTFSLN